MEHTWRWCAGLALAAAWAAAGWAAPAPAPDVKDADATRYIPGGVADAAGARGYVRNADRGVTALDLETGKPLWDFKADARPVALRGGRVLVQVREKPNVLRVVGLDAEKGEKAWESDPIVLPDWVNADPGRWGGYSYSSSTRLDKSDLLLSWQAATWYWGGAAPTPQILKASQRNAGGVADVNLDSGKVEMLDAAKAPPPPADRFTKAQLEKAAASLFPNAPPDQVKFDTSGDVAVGVEQAGGKWVLKRYDLAADKPLEPVTVGEADAVQLIPATGVAIAKRKGGQGYDVYSLETGKELGTVPDEPNTTDLTVLGPRALYVVRGDRKGPQFGAVIPQTLRAVDVKTGKRLWDQPLEGERLPPPPPP